MAKTTNTEHVVRVSADFSAFVRAANKAQDKFTKRLEEGTHKALYTKAVQAQKKALEAYQKQRELAEKKWNSLSFAMEARRLGKAEAERKKLEKEVSKINSALASRRLTDTVRQQKEAERKLANMKLGLLKTLDKKGEKGAKDLLRTFRNEMEGVSRDIERVSQTAVHTMDQIERGASRAQDLMKVFRRDATKGADDFNDRMSDAVNSLRSGLSDIDLGSMLSGGGLGKGIGGIAEILGGAASGMTGTLSVVVGALSGVALALGPIVIALGAFAGMMFGIDKEVKEFNKTAVNTFGTRSVVNLGLGDMRTGLTTLRHVTQDLNNTLGMTSEEALGLFDAIDAGGVSMANLVRGINNAADREQHLIDVMQKTASTAKALGVGVNEFAGTIAEYTDTLAFSLESVSDQFALISKQAQDAGFSTRRFYSLITQATAAQASLNTHLDDTAALLVRMSKVLGQKTAAEALGGAAGGFKEMGTQERYKTIMTTGAGRTKGIIEDAAARAARTFAVDFARGGSGDAIANAIRTAGLDFDVEAITRAGADSYNEEATRGLVDQLAGMTREQQAELIAAVRAGDPATARRLEQLVSLSRGTSGSMADMSDALSSLDPGATIAMKLQSAMAILGRPLHELSGVERMAAESITGMSGDQFEQYQRLAEDAEGRMMILTRLAESGRDTAEEDRAAMAEQYGAIIENGKIISATVRDGAVVTGAEITSGMDLLTTSLESGAMDASEAVDENLVLAQDAYDETVTISEVLQNEIAGYLRGLYEDFGLPMIDMVADLVHKFVGGPSREERRGGRDLRDALTKNIREATSEKTTAERTVRTLSRKGDLSEEEQAQLNEARATIEMATAVIEDSESALRAARAGDTSALRGREYRTERGVYASRAAAERTGLPIEEREITLGASTAAGIIAMRARSDAGRRFAMGSPAAAAPPSAPTPATPVATAPTVAPATAPAPAAAGPTTRATEEAAATVHEPIVAATEEVAATTSTEAEATRKTIDDSAIDTRKHLDKILTKDKKLGDALARSNLPDAIVAAQIKQQIASLAFAAGLDPTKAAEAVEEYMTEGTFSGALTGALGTLDEGTKALLAPTVAGLGGLLGGTTATGTPMATSLGGTRRLGGDETVTEEVDDFIYRGDGVRGTITPIDTADEFVGMKPGGPIDRATGGGNVTVNIYGGDERRVFDVVKRVLNQTGIGPGRVAARA